MARKANCISQYVCVAHVNPVQYCIKCHNMYCEHNICRCEQSFNGHDDKSNFTNEYIAGRTFAEARSIFYLEIYCARWQTIALQSFYNYGYVIMDMT